MLGTWTPAQPTNSPLLFSRSRSSSEFWEVCGTVCEVEERLFRPAWDPAHIFVDHTEKPAGFSMWNPAQISGSIELRVGCEVKVVEIILTDTRLNGVEAKGGN